MKMIDLTMPIWEGGLWRNFALYKLFRAALGVHVL